MSGDRGSGGWWPDGDGGQERPGGREPARRREPSPPPRGLESRDRPRPSGRYSMFVGLAFVALIIFALVNLLENDDAGIELQRGLPLAEFAVPDALAGIDADANVAQDNCESSRNPCPADDVRTPACRIDTPGAIRVCDLFGRPLAISFWFTRGGDCIPSQNAFDEVARRYRDRVNFLSIDIRDDPGTVAGIIRDNGWRVPVGLDRDGAVSNLYRVGVCPTIVLAYPGGIVYDTAIRAGNYDAAEIDDLIGELLAESEKREREVR